MARELRCEAAREVATREMRMSEPTPSTDSGNTGLDDRADGGEPAPG
jgi:hypothetical protein